MALFYDRQTFEEKVKPGDVVCIITHPERGDGFERSNVLVGIYEGSTKTGKSGKLICHGKESPPSGFREIAGVQFSYDNVVRIEKLMDKGQIASSVGMSLGPAAGQDYQSSFR